MLKSQKIVNLSILALRMIEYHGINKKTSKKWVFSTIFGLKTSIKYWFLLDQQYNNPKIKLTKYELFYVYTFRCKPQTLQLPAIT